MPIPFGDLQAHNDGGKAVLTWSLRTLHECPAMPAGEFDTWRIYRRYHPDFDMQCEGPERFMAPAGAPELVYTGPVPAEKGRCRWADPDAPAGSICSYYVASATSGMVGPLPLRLHDPDIVWPYAALLPRLQALAEAALAAGVHANLVIRGHSAAGRAIHALELGEGDYGIAYIGTQHAAETGPELIVPMLERVLARRPELLRSARVLLLPNSNPDRREELCEGVPWYLRTNLQGIDLNRNFPVNWEKVSYSYGADSSDPHSGTYRGPEPLWAPEARAIIAALSAFNPDVVFNYHWVYSLCALPALTTPLARDDALYIARCWRIIRAWGEALFPGGDGLMPDATDLIPGLPQPGDWLRIDGSGGSLNAWVYRALGVPGLTCEGHLARGTDASQHGRVDRALMEEYRERHARGLVALLEARL